MPQVARAEAQLAEGVATPDSAALRESYLMYVLPVSAFMQMVEWRPHQDLFEGGRDCGVDAFDAWENLLRIAPMDEL